MNNVLSKFLDKFVLVFIDDILVYSKNEVEHEENLRKVLETLQEHHLYAKLSKCEFYEKQVEYLGHVISEKGIAVDLEKIKAILKLHAPKDVHDIRPFMGLTRYYHRFIENFSKISYPITTLQKKSVRFIWNQQCQNNFEKLKHLLITSPVLKVFDPSKDFVVCTIESKEWLGGVLTQ